MQLPTIDRTPNARPAGVDLASSGASRVIPVAPVNPAVHASPKLETASPSAVAQPGVIDMVNPALKNTNETERVHVAQPDPVSSNSMKDAVPKDWTIHRPKQQEVEAPPPKPISQILMDHLKTMWTASASAVQVEQVANQLNANAPTPTTSSQMPGDLAKEAVIYAPAKIKKNENI